MLKYLDGWGPIKAVLVSPSSFVNMTFSKQTLS